MGSADGAIRAAATRRGITEAEYRLRVAAGWKWCGGCRDWRKRVRFGSDTSRRDGLKSRCRAHDIQSVGPSKAERRAWATAGLAWCRSCEAWLPIDEIRLGLCRDHVRAAARQWYADGGWRSRQGRATARRRGVAHLGADTRESIFESTDGLCAYSCGRPATSIDHVIPVALGGKTQPGNIVPACLSCNSAKRDGNPIPWIKRMTEAGWHLISPGLLYDGAGLDAWDLFAA